MRRPGRGPNERILGIGFTLLFGAFVAFIPYYVISGFVLRQPSYLCGDEVDWRVTVKDFPRGGYCVRQDPDDSSRDIVRLISADDMHFWTGALILLIACAVAGSLIVLFGVARSVRDAVRRRAISRQELE